MLPSIAELDFGQPVPIFPLPNAVLLPRAILPLHLFEPRYREMGADALASAGLIALALLDDGYEANYYTHLAPIKPVICLGRIVRDEPLDDGRMNILLQGVCRATVERELRDHSYRTGILRPLTDDDPPDDGQRRIFRDRIDAHLNADRIPALVSNTVLLDVIRCPTLEFSDALDLLAFNLFTEPRCRQGFLNQPGERRRAECLLKYLADFRAGLRECAPARADDAPARED